MVTASVKFNCRSFSNVWSFKVGGLIAVVSQERFHCISRNSRVGIFAILVRVSLLIPDRGILSLEKVLVGRNIKPYVIVTDTFYRCTYSCYRYLWPEARYACSLLYSCL